MRALTRMDSMQGLIKILSCQRMLNPIKEYINASLLDCVAIGCFNHIEILLKSGVQVRSFPPVGYQQKLLSQKYTINIFQQALLNTQMASDALDLCESLFGIKYPLSKLDHVSCHQLVIRAMKNWGCITVKRNILLYNFDVDTDELFQKTKYIQSEWRGGALAQIQLSVQVGVPEPADQLQSIFDTISYAKGSAICRMLYASIGDDSIFFLSLKAYMEKFDYVYKGICFQRSIQSHNIYQCLPLVKLERTSPTTYTLTQSLKTQTPSGLSHLLPLSSNRH